MAQHFNIEPFLQESAQREMGLSIAAFQLPAFAGRKCGLLLVFNGPCVTVDHEFILAVYLTHQSLWVGLMQI